MTSLLKIGLILMAVTLLLVLVHPAEADDDVKRKRVIIKIPHRVKHIYHHHSKKVHVHKKKPKPKPKKKKPHKHVHVVVEEEEIVQPIKNWKTIPSPFKGGKTGWDDWKAAPSGFKHSVKHPDDFGSGEEASHLEEEFSFEDDHDSRESRTYGRPHSYKSIIMPSSSSGGGSGKRGKKKGGRSSSSSYRSQEEPNFEASYEVYHHHDDDRDFEGERPRRKPKSKMSSGASTAPKSKARGGYTPGRPTYRQTTRRPRFEDIKYPEPNEYDELYERGPAYPERKEHPSWHDRSRYHPEQEAPAGVGSEQNIWSFPSIPPVNEYIDDVNDTPDPGVTYGNSGGFYPSSYNPITTITSSVVESSQAVHSGVQDFRPHEPFPANEGFNNGYGNGFNIRPNNGFHHSGGRPPVPQQRPAALPVVPADHPVQQQRPFNNDNNNNNNNNKKLPKKPKKNPGYLSQVSHTSEGLTIGYQSHIGHSSDAGSPSSSFQSVSYGGIKA